MSFHQITVASAIAMIRQQPHNFRVADANIRLADGPGIEDLLLGQVCWT